MTATTPNEEMVEEYLQQALGMEDEDPEEVFTIANCVQTVDVSLSSERVTSCMNSLVIEDHEKLVSWMMERTPVLLVTDEKWWQHTPLERHI